MKTLKTFEVDLTVRIKLEMSDDTKIGDISTVIDELDYSFTDNSGMANILDVEIKDSRIVGVKKKGVK